MVNELAQRQNGTSLSLSETARSLAERPAGNIQPATFSECIVCAEWFAASGMYGIKSPAQALTILMTGLELGLTAAQSMQSIFVIENRPSLSAQLIVALALSKPEVCEYFRLVKSDNEIATYVTKRVGNPEVSYSYTHEMAHNAGLLNKDNWKKSKPDMLRARCVSGLGRIVYPDILKGLYIPDEIRSGDVDEDLKSAQIVTIGHESTPPVSRVEEAKQKIQAKAKPVETVPSGQVVQTTAVNGNADKEAEIDPVIKNYYSKLAERTPREQQAIVLWLREKGWGDDVLKLAFDQYTELKAATRGIFERVKADEAQEKAAAAKAEAPAGEPEREFDEMVNDPFALEAE